ADTASNCVQNANLCTNASYQQLMAQQCKSTCGLCSGSTSCVDKLNPSTGVSDCPGLAYLCNNTTYYTLMGQSIGPCIGGACPAGYYCSGSTCYYSSSSTTTCVDKLNPSTGVSDCPGVAYLCSNSVYYTLMGQSVGPCIGSSCPAGYSCISGSCISNTPAPSTTCVDQVNPSTGVSDCPADAYLCNNSNYYTLMTQQCPKTCGRCSTSTSSSTTCVDQMNSSTGSSDCSSLSYLCNNSAYYTIMTQQCPKTCGRCTSG
ncbi:hypothetical protein FO519_009575, partial [Halicephalobus sp. NKZ332]